MMASMVQQPPPFQPLSQPEAGVLPWYARFETQPNPLQDKRVRRDRDVLSVLKFIYIKDFLKSPNFKFFIFLP